MGSLEDVRTEGEVGHNHGIAFGLPDVGAALSLGVRLPGVAAEPLVECRLPGTELGRSWSSPSGSDSNTPQR
jgi:hypothetical protein